MVPVENIVIHHPETSVSGSENEGSCPRSYIYIYGYNISYHVHKSTFSHLISLLSSKYAKKSMHLSLLVLYTTASINNLRTCAVPHVLQNSKPWDHGRMFFW